jgi:alpha-tubulin suppressor-like RCC1 family protein
MATVSLGKIAFKYRGAYSASDTYASQDIVTYLGSSYVCTVDNTTGTDPLNTSNWSQFAAGIDPSNLSVGSLVAFDGTSFVDIPVGNVGDVLTVGAQGMPAFGLSGNRPALRVKALSKCRGFSNYSTFCIMEDGSVRAWGANGVYQLGIGATTSNRTYPSTVAFPNGAPAIEKLFNDYYNNTYAIDANGGFWAWGGNDYGTIGMGVINTDVYTPLCVTAINDIQNSLYGKQVVKVATKISADQYESTHVLCTDGTVHACGYNAYGQLGDGSTTDKYWYSQINIINNIVDLQAGRGRYTAVFALNASGEVYSWGNGGGNILGHGSTSNLTIPNKIATLNGINIVSMSVAGEHACFLADNGDLYAVGENTTYGNLGTGDTIDRLTPVLVATDVAQVYAMGVSSSGRRTYIVKTDGSLWACGSNVYSGLGVDATTTHYANFAPCLKTEDDGVTTSPMTGVVDLSPSGNATPNVILKDANNICWGLGYNATGVLGNGNNLSTSTYFRPVLIHRRSVVDFGLSGPESAMISQFLLDDGQLYISGSGGNNQNTDDDADNWFVPGPVIF